MKKIEWATPNRMKFDSLHKTFNRQTQVIVTGNILSNTLSGSYVRAYNKIECNGYTNAPGHLQANTGGQTMTRRAIYEHGVIIGWRLYCEVFGVVTFCGYKWKKEN